MSCKDSESTVDFYEACKRCLDHLCLPEQQSNACVEIKLVVAFDYKKKEGRQCLLPGMSAAVLSSVPVAPGIEQASLDKIYNIFVTEFLSTFRQRAFGWDTVELPAAMVQRLEARDSRNLSMASASEAFLFPNPMVAASTPRPSFLRSNSDADFAFTDMTLSTNCLSSNISDFLVTSTAASASEPSISKPFVPLMHNSSTELSSESSISLDLISSIPTKSLLALCPPSPSFSLLAEGITRGRGRHTNTSKEPSHHSKFASPAMNKTSDGTSRRNPNLTSLMHALSAPVPNNPFHFVQHRDQAPTASSASVITTPTLGKDDRRYTRITQLLQCAIGVGELQALTIDLIWNCINGVYDPESWGAILVACGVDEGRIGMVIEVMKAAKRAVD
ncbi:hypothetical protein JVT61DRAFT_10135 [Boletus reticuloceps]|uniref:Uncharacterized protein n=1 Tax=Boletus reticuloceps TaxID=495285 RepID=A0A8I2YYS5_9AGAM|nr:hypothetical protein JVT61DRAFT_10135 [Boletus reticuloceps]